MCKELDFLCPLSAGCQVPVNPKRRAEASRTPRVYEILRDLHIRDDRRTVDVHKKYTEENASRVWYGGSEIRRRRNEKCSCKKILPQRLFYNNTDEHANSKMARATLIRLNPVKTGLIICQIGAGARPAGTCARPGPRCLHFF
ncbi:hypothetical protein EVAR_66176_1 [Eumeta japonica]|uniref:Uncharacterized protein n=1 Tax=Eumeta variegata TaxID=151549 RepID=A0A4C1ZLZ0_EUMVA|nr:hypothetical protein EVAR_66176_1 [Eumeta japonica]